MNVDAWLVDGFLAQAILVAGRIYASGYDLDSDRATDLSLDSPCWLTGVLASMRNRLNLVVRLDLSSALGVISAVRIHSALACGLPYERKPSLQYLFLEMEQKKFAGVVALVLVLRLQTEASLRESLMALWHYSAVKLGVLGPVY